MNFTDGDTIGKLAPTPPEVQSRFREISGSNVAWPKSIDASYPVSPVLDVTRKRRATELVFQSLTGTLANGTISIDLFDENGLFDLLWTRDRFRVINASIQVVPTGNGVFEVMTRAVWRLPTTLWSFELSNTTIDTASTSFVYYTLLTEPTGWFPVKRDFFNADAQDREAGVLRAFEIQWARAAGAGTISIAPSFAIEHEL